MPLFLVPLISWLTTTIVSVITFMLTRKGILFATMVSVVTIVGAAIQAIISEVDGLISSVLPSVAIVTMFVPNNSAACFGAIVAAHIACTSYKMAVKFIRWKTEIMTS